MRSSSRRFNDILRKLKNFAIKNLTILLSRPPKEMFMNKRILSFRCPFGCWVTLLKGIPANDSFARIMRQIHFYSLLSDTCVRVHDITGCVLIEFNIWVKRILNVWQPFPSRCLVSLISGQTPTLHRKIAKCRHFTQNARVKLLIIHANIHICSYTASLCYTFPTLS